jgi:ATP-dependent RNA helicase DDX47/RRP3
MAELQQLQDSSNFESLGLDPTIVRVLKELNFEKPTEIQAQAIPWALKRRDVIGLAQTGSGKTLAFALPIIHSMLQEQTLHAYPYAVVVSPTRELAMQISEQFALIGRELGLRTAVVVGGVDMMGQAVALAKQPHVVIATPGRLVDHLENTKGFSLRHCKFLVLDEADRLLDLDFGPHLDKIIRSLPRFSSHTSNADGGEKPAMPKDRAVVRQTFLFSATMTSKVEKLQRAAVCNPVRIQVGAGKFSTVTKLQQSYLFFPLKLKDAHCAYLLSEWKGHSAIVFLATCANAQRVSLLLRHLGLNALPLHGQMDQHQRTAALAKFKGGQAEFLVATDVASRGLDIPDVDYVLNFDVPLTSKDYIHRVGRTARAGKAGIAVTLVTQYDIEALQRIEANLGFKLAEYPRPLDKQNLLLVSERVAEAQRHVQLELKEREQLRKLKKGPTSSSSFRRKTRIANED